MGFSARLRSFYPITDKEILCILHLLYDHKLITIKKLQKILYLLDKFDLIGTHNLSSEEGKKPVIFEYFTLRVSLAEKIQLDPKRVMALQEIMEIS